MYVVVFDPSIWLKLQWVVLSQIWTLNTPNPFRAQHIFPGTAGSRKLSIPWWTLCFWNKRKGHLFVGGSMCVRRRRWTSGERSDLRSWELRHVAYYICWKVRGIGLREGSDILGGCAIGGLFVLGCFVRTQVSGGFQFLWFCVLLLLYEITACIWVGWRTFVKDMTQRLSFHFQLSYLRTKCINLIITINSRKMINIPSWYLFLPVRQTHNTFFVVVGSIFWNCLHIDLLADNYLFLYFSSCRIKRCGRRRRHMLPPIIT